MTRTRVAMAVAALVTFFAGLTYLVGWVLGHSAPLLGEDGLFEVGSFGVWSVLAAVCGVAAYRTTRREGRYLSGWIGWVAALLAVRELDAHVHLNPQTLGEYGVRYRIDWWLNGEVSLMLKLGWLALGSVFLWLTIYPAWSARRMMLRLWQDRPVSFICIPAGVLLLAAGYVMDDLLRGHTFDDKVIRSLVEEGMEFVGAGLIAIGSLVMVVAGVKESGSVKSDEKPAA